jgi:hypothetical protein
MRNSLIILSVLLSASVLATNSDVKEFFNENKIGHSVDYGVFKNGTDHTISIHGFDNDLDVCLEIVAMLNEKQPDTYSCKPLNH